MKAYGCCILGLAAAALAGAASAQTPPVANPPAIARPAASTPVPAPSPGASAPTVGGVTVQPATPPQGRVVSSTDAAPLASPNYTDDDAQPAPRALSLGGSTAAGVRAIDTAPPAGLPASMDPGPPRGSVGVTTVF